MSETQMPPATVTRVPRPRYATALERFFGDLPSAERGQRIDAVLEQDKDGGKIYLFEARRETDTLGMVLGVAQEGRTAVVWAPRLFVEEDSEVLADRLLVPLQAALQAAGIHIAQALLECDAKSEGKTLERAGFNRVGDLLYMVSLPQELQFVPPDEMTSEPTPELAFVVSSPEEEPRLERVVEATYRETLDCPQLDGIREISDVLTGYRANGEFDPRRWLIVRYQDADVGCLLLSDYPETGHWELVYMGLIPEVRGRKLGLEVVRHAQRIAREAGRDRLILAVDADNEPAIKMYMQAGFNVWDRRRVFLKVYDH